MSRQRIIALEEKLRSATIIDSATSRPTSSASAARSRCRTRSPATWCSTPSWVRRGRPDQRPAVERVPGRPRHHGRKKRRQGHGAGPARRRRKSQDHRHRAGLEPAPDSSGPGATRHAGGGIGADRADARKLAALRARGDNAYPARFDPATRSPRCASSSTLGDGRRAPGDVTRGRPRHGEAAGTARSSFVVRQGRHRRTCSLRQPWTLLGDQGYERLLRLDLGDIVGSDGHHLRTRRGELTVRADALAAAHQVPAPAAREVPRPQGPRDPLPPALRRPHRQPRRRARPSSSAPASSPPCAASSTTAASSRSRRRSCSRSPAAPLARPFVTHHNALDATSTCASPPSSTSSAASSAASTGSTRSARTSATRASASSTTPSSR